VTHGSGWKVESSEGTNGSHGCLSKAVRCGVPSPEMCNFSRKLALLGVESGHTISRALRARARSAARPRAEPRRVFTVSHESAAPYGIHSLCRMYPVSCAAANPLIRSGNWRTRDTSRVSVTPRRGSSTAREDELHRGPRNHEKRKRNEPPPVVCTEGSQLCRADWVQPRVAGI
jgi:hypothetical protein